MSFPLRAPSDEEAVALLTAMVAIPSVSGRESALARYLCDALGAFGLDAAVDEVGNVVVQVGQGPRHIALVGHLDTVPGEIPVRREGRLLHGRGAVDAKGPLACFLVAAARVAASGLDACLSVVGAVEEEAATSRGARHIAERLQPDMALIGEPSGWERVTLGYKGRLLVDYVLEQPMAHTAGAVTGACEQAVAYWQHLSAWAAAYNAGREGLFARVDPSLRSIRSDSDGLRERVEMHIGLRLPPGLDAQALLADVIGAAAGGAQVATHGYEPPFCAERRTPLVAALSAAIRAEGGKPGYLLKTGTSDMNVLGPRWGCPIAAYGPGDSALDHTPHEHIDLDEYLRSARVLERALRRLAAA